MVQDDGFEGERDRFSDRVVGVVVLDIAEGKPYRARHAGVQDSCGCGIYRNTAGRRGGEQPHKSEARGQGVHDLRCRGPPFRHGDGEGVDNFLADDGLERAVSSGGEFGASDGFDKGGRGGQYFGRFGQIFGGEIGTALGSSVVKDCSGVGGGAVDRHGGGQGEVVGDDDAVGAVGHHRVGVGVVTPVERAEAGIHVVIIHQLHGELPVRAIPSDGVVSAVGQGGAIPALNDEIDLRSEGGVGGGDGFDVGAGVGIAELHVKGVRSTGVPKGNGVADLVAGVGKRVGEEVLGGDGDGLVGGGEAAGGEGQGIARSTKDKVWAA